VQVERSNYVMGVPVCCGGGGSGDTDDDNEKPVLFQFLIAQLFINFNIAAAFDDDDDDDDDE